MKKIYSFLFILCSFSLLNAQDDFSEANEGYQFEVVNECQFTQIKSQGKTGTCWSFSTQSYLESELLRKGEEPIDLSEMFVVRNIYLQKAEKYLRYHGKTNFSEGSLGHDPINVLKEYGAMTEESYSGKLDSENPHDHKAMFKEIKTYLDRIIQEDKIPSNWKKEVNDLMDRHMGPVKENFKYQDKAYNPKSFAAEFMELDANNYISLTSFSHHPFYTKFVLEVPDNFSDEAFYNIPIEELSALADHALKKGYSFEWDCDVSEKGFSTRQGIAVVPKVDLNSLPKEKVNELLRVPHPQKEINQEMRQTAFDSYQLTDDHLMHVIGLIKDQNGDFYYKVKNSWGKRGKYEGILYASKAYFEMNTVSILIHVDAIPVEIKSKLGL